MGRSDEFNVGSAPVPEVAAGAARFRQMMGYREPEQDYSQSVIPASANRAIAAHYAQMPSYDRAAEPAYRAMAEETGRQYDFMTRPRAKGGLGINVSVSDDDPYQAGGPSHVIRNLRSDVQDNSHIAVLSTRSTGGHPFFTNDQNDMFRAVHDVFGHLGSGRAVDFDGEEAAYQKHAAMFSPLARGALAAETRGQNSYLRVHGDFPEQKVGLLPGQYAASRNLSPQQFGEMAAARERARAKNREFGITP